MSCEHSERRLTMRSVRSGVVQYVYQCMTCGAAASQPISHARIAREFSGIEIADFDDQLETAYNLRRGAEWRQEQADKRAAFFERYGVYLKSPEWAERRRLVLARCKHVCEGCGKRPAVEVHHLTYEHVFDEFLFELLGLCKPCHDRVHAEPSGRE